MGGKVEELVACVRPREAGSVVYNRKEVYESTSKLFVHKN